MRIINWIIDNSDLANLILTFIVGVGGLILAGIIGNKQIRISRNQQKFSEHQAKLDNLRFEIDQFQILYSRERATQENNLNKGLEVGITLLKQITERTNNLLNQYEELSKG